MPRLIRFAVLVCVFASVFLVPRPASAAEPGDAYEGTTSDGGSVRVVARPDGIAVVTVRHPDRAGACTAAFEAETKLLGATTSQFIVNEAAAGGGAKASISGFFSLPDRGAVAGAFSDIGGMTPRSATWIATRVAPPPAAMEWPYRAGVKLEGIAYNVTGTRLGTAETTTAADGTVTVRIAVTIGACEYRMSQTSTGALTGPQIDLSSAAGRIAAITSPTAIGGGYRVEPSPTCSAPLAGMFVALAPRPGFVAPPAFGFASTTNAVFQGGSAADLEAAAKIAGATGVWALDTAGTPRLLIVDAPAWVNQPVRDALRAGLAASTTVTLTR